MILKSSNLCQEISLFLNDGEIAMKKIEQEMAALMHDLHRAYSTLSGREYQAKKERTFNMHRILKKEKEQYMLDNPEYFI